MEPSDTAETSGSVLDPMRPPPPLFEFCGLSVTARGVVAVGFTVGCCVEYHARMKSRTSPRILTTVGLLACLIVLLIIAVLDYDYNSLGELWQPVCLATLPAAVFLLGVVCFPEGVPQRDQTCVFAFFVIVAAASIHQTMSLWHVCGNCLQAAGVKLDTEPIHPVDVKKATLVLSSAAICAHALAIGMTQCRDFWWYTRASFGFGGALRLAAAAVLRALGVGDAPCYPPTSLTPTSSLLVSSTYFLLALGFTYSRRRALTWAVARVRCHLRYAVASPPAAVGTAPLPIVNTHGAMGGLCMVCMDAPNDHAFITCGHLCACGACAEFIHKESATCPICRSLVTGVLKTYLP